MRPNTGSEAQENIQNSDDPLAISPAHLAHELDACHKIACAAGPEKEPVVEHEIARHTDSFGVCYSASRKESAIRSLPKKQSDQMTETDRKASSMIGRASSMLFVSLLIPLEEKERPSLWDKTQAEDANRYLHPFDDSIDLMPPFCPLAFFTVEHHPMLDLWFLDSRSIHPR